MKRAKCKSFLSGSWLLIQLLEKGREIKTKPKSIVPIDVMATKPPESQGREADSMTGHSQPRSRSPGPEESICMFFSFQKLWERPQEE